MNLFTGKWPFYVSGPLLAILVVLSLYIFNDVIGMGDATTVATEYCSEALREHRAGDPPSLDWQLGLFIGILVGAFVAVLMGNKYKAELMAEGEGSFTIKVLRTVGGGIAGGFLVMLGIQFSGDTVFGHLTAAMQLSGGAWIFLIAMTVTGGALAILLERKGEGGAKKPAKAAAKK